MMDVTSVNLKIPQLSMICCIFWLANRDMVSDVYLPCDEEVDLETFNITEEQSIDHPTSDGIISMYHSETGVTWCEAYRTCRNMSSDLFMISSQDLQDVISHFNSTNSSDRAWISGTRKIHGLNWTWVNESLTDCATDDCYTLNVETGEFGFIVLGDGTYQLRSTDILDKTKTGYCSSGSLPDSNLNWYEKQLRCLEEDSHLATLADALTAPIFVSYMIGLKFQPWIWVRDDEFYPVIYTSWAPGDRQPAGMADCLEIELNPTSPGAWNEHSCSDQLHYFVCEGVKKMLTTVDPSVESTFGSRQSVEKGSTHLFTGEHDTTSSMVEEITSAPLISPKTPLIPAVAVLAVVVIGLVAALIGQQLFWRKRLKSTQLKSSKEHLEYEDTAETMAAMPSTPSRDLKHENFIGLDGEYQQITSLERRCSDKDPVDNGPVSYEQINLHNVTPWGNNPYTGLNFNSISPSKID